MVHVLQCVFPLAFLQCVLSVLFCSSMRFIGFWVGGWGWVGWSGLITSMCTCARTGSYALTRSCVIKHLRACFLEVFVSNVSLWLLDAASFFGRFLMLACSSMDPINPFLKSGSGVIRLMFILHITC